MSIISDAEAQDIVGAEASDTLVPMLRPLVEKVVQDRIGWTVERGTYTRYYPPHDRGAVGERFPGEFGTVPQHGSRARVIRLHHKFVLLAGLQVWEAPGALFGQADDFDADTLLTIGDDYTLDTEDGAVSEGGHLRRRSSYWPRQPGSVRVTYTAGFTADELDGTGGTTDASDIRLAILMQFQKTYKEASAWRKTTGVSVAGPLMSESVPGYRYSVGAVMLNRLQGFASVLVVAVEELIHKYRRYDL